MPEPTKLLSAEEFRKGFIQMNPVAVHDLCYAALKRVAELEAERDAWGSARLPAVERERDALAAELAELRAAVVEQAGGSSCGACRSLRKLAAQPQGERGVQILAMAEAARRHADMVSRACEADSPIEYSDYENFAFELLQMFAAIDGAQP